MFRVDRRSLRFRLLAWLFGTALLVTGATWFLHGILLRELARDFLGERLQRETNHAIHQLQQDRSAAPVTLNTTSQDYQIFHHLYVLRLGDRIFTSSGRWRETLSPLLENAGDGLVEVIEGEWHFLVYRKHFTLQDERGVLLIGEDFSQLAEGLAELRWWVGGIAAFVLLLLLTLNLVAVNRGLKPLSQLREQLDELHKGNLQRLSLRAPSELDALVAQLNRFMDEIESRLQRSRESTANLSHALKTPLAAVTQVLRGSRPIEGERRDKVLQRMEDIHALLSAELRRSRIAGPCAGTVTHLGRDSARLVEMFRSLYPEKHFLFDLAPGPERTVPLEPHDFSEMLGVVLDNAGKWSSSEVDCRIEVTDSITITVDDDGPGVASEDMRRLGLRGVRLDERHPGYGLGLSILDQLTDRYSGNVSFSRSPKGGLRVAISIPAAND